MSIMRLNKILMLARSVSNVPTDMPIIYAKVLKFSAIFGRLNGKKFIASGEILKRIMSMQ